MSDLDDLLTRVAHLERFNRRLEGENRLLKGLGALLAVGALSLLLLGGRGLAEGPKAGDGPPGEAACGGADEKKGGKKEGKQERVVEAERFLLRDGANRIRAAVWMAASGPKYDLYDEKGVLRATLALGKNGDPILMFFSANRKPQVALMVEGDKRILSLLDASARQRVVLTHGEGGGGLSFTDERGKAALTLGDGPEGRGLTVGDANGKKRLSLGLEKDRAALKVFDAKGQALFEKP